MCNCLTYLEGLDTRLVNRTYSRSGQVKYSTNTCVTLGVTIGSVNQWLMDFIPKLHICIEFIQSSIRLCFAPW